MKHFTKIGLTFVLILITTNIYSNKSERIKLSGIDFYNKNQQEFNLNDSIAKNGQVILDYKKAGRFSINYSVDSLIDGELIKYKIEGYDYNWINANDCRTIMITNLNAGRYAIKIGIFNNENQIEENNFNLVITPPIWKAWWVKSIITMSVFVMFIISLIVLIIINSKLRSKLNSTNK